MPRSDDTARRRDQGAPKFAMPPVMAASPDAAEAARKAFTNRVIATLEASAAQRRQPRSQEQLANAAWQALQYDFAQPSADELAALAGRLAASLQGKAAWPAYHLTSKAVENAVAGARRSSSAAAAAAAAQRADEGAAAALGDALAQAGLGEPAGAAPASQGAWQALCGVLLLQYAAKAVALPEADAWRLLAQFSPEPCQPQQQPSSLAPAGAQHAAALADADSDTALAEAAWAQAVAHAAGAPVGRGGGSVRPADCEGAEAAQQDEDGEQYEAMELPSRSTAHAARAALAQSQPQPQPPQLAEPYSWDALRAKLLALAEPVHYRTLLSHESLWAQGGAAQHLLQLLRALGVHRHAEQLAPMLHAYVGVLVDRLVACPADLPLLAQLWEALGLASQQPGQARKAARGQALPAEAVLGFSVAASVWQQLPGTSPRRLLWRLLWEQLLPLLEACSEQLAYGSQPGRQGAGAGGAEGGGEARAHTLLLCHIIELLVLGRPAHVDAAGRLTQLGVTRNLAALFSCHAGEPGAEPVRRAALLAACSSQATCAWLLAVPLATQQLAAPAFQQGGVAEAHGAVWQLLSAAGGPQRAAGAAAPSELLQLLGLDSGDAQALCRQVGLLQLMADAQQAAGPGQRLFGAAVTSQLRALAARLKEGGERRADAAATAPSSSSSSSSKVDGSDKGEAADADTLSARASQQLQPRALRLIKELLTAGSKTD